MMDLPTCYCGAPARLRESQHGCFWGCTCWPKCDGLVGCHPGTSKPLGNMADRHTRSLRADAHMVFEPIWMGLAQRPFPVEGTWRALAYRWLATLVGRPGESIHMGEMTGEEARRAIALLADKGPTDLLAFLRWELEEAETS